MDNIEWVAGLFEGEGCVTVDYRSNGFGYPRVTLGMSDEDVVQRLMDSVGCGVIKVRPFEHKKRMYYWTINKKEDVLPFLRTLLPYMGTRRTLKFQEAIEVIEEATSNLNCVLCDKKFSPAKRSVKYCSQYCRKKATR